MNLLIQLPNPEGPTSLFHGTHPVSDVDRPDAPTVGHAKVKALSILGEEHFELTLTLALDLNDPEEDRIYVAHWDAETRSWSEPCRQRAEQNATT